MEESAPKLIQLWENLLCCWLPAGDHSHILQAALIPRHEAPNLPMSNCVFLRLRISLTSSATRQRNYSALKGFVKLDLAHHVISVLRSNN